MSIFFAVYVLGFATGSLFSGGIHYYKKHKQDKEEIKEETTTDDVFLHANDMSEISKDSEDKIKFNIMKDLMLSIRMASEMGQYTWYAHQATSVTQNVREHMTQQEVLDILEPLGYKVSFNPISADADLLRIKWNED